MEREEVVLQDTFEEEGETRMMWLYDYTHGSLVVQCNNGSRV